MKDIVQHLVYRSVVKELFYQLENRKKDLQPMEGGLPSDDEEVLLPYGKELEEARINCEYSESAVLPVHHQALLVQHQTSPQAKNS